MIGWLQSIDVSLFRFINVSLTNSFFDRLMPFLSDSPWFACLFLALAVFLVWKGGARGRVCVLMLALSLCLGNWLICDSIKNAVARLRPFPNPARRHRASRKRRQFQPAFLPRGQLVLRDPVAAGLLPPRRMGHAAAGAAGLLFTHL